MEEFNHYKLRFSLFEQFLEYFVLFPTSFELESQSVFICVWMSRCLAMFVNPLNVNPTKWSNTRYVWFTLKGLNFRRTSPKGYLC